MLENISVGLNPEVNDINRVVLNFFKYMIAVHIEEK
jgi:hypothetical protein